MVTGIAEVAAFPVNLSALAVGIRGYVGTCALSLIFQKDGEHLQGVLECATAGSVRERVVLTDPVAIGFKEDECAW